MKTDGNRDEIITVAQVERALAQLAQVRSVNLPAHTTAVVVPNTDADSFIDSPFTQVLTKDAIPAKGEKAFEPGADLPKIATINGCPVFQISETWQKEVSFFRKKLCLNYNARSLGNSHATRPPECHLHT